VPKPKPISTKEAAAIADMTPATFRSTMLRERAKGRDYRVRQMDERTPVWDEHAIRTWNAGRLGRAEKKDTDHA
jgi:hypothetical protein